MILKPHLCVRAHAYIYTCTELCKRLMAFVIEVSVIWDTICVQKFEHMAVIIKVRVKWSEICVHAIELMVFLLEIRVLWTWNCVWVHCAHNGSKDYMRWNLCPHNWTHEADNETKGYITYIKWNLCANVCANSVYNGSKGCMKWNLCAKEWAHSVHNASEG